MNHVLHDATLTTSPIKYRPGMGPFVIQIIDILFAKDICSFDRACFLKKLPVWAAPPIFNHTEILLSRKSNRDTTEEKNKRAFMRGTSP